MPLSPSHMLKQSRSSNSSKDHVLGDHIQPLDRPVSPSSNAKHQGPQEEQAQQVPGHAVPLLWTPPIPSPLDHPAPSSFALSIAVRQGDARTSTINVPMSTVTSHSRRTRGQPLDTLCVPTKRDRPMPRDHVLEHHRTTRDRPTTLPTPIAPCNHVADEHHPCATVSQSNI